MADYQSQSSQMKLSLFNKDQPGSICKSNHNQASVSTSASASASASSSPPLMTSLRNSHHEHYSLTTPTLSLSTRHRHNLLRTCDHKLLSLLHDHKTEEAWLAYSHSTHLPNSTCLSRLVFQLSYQNTLSSLTRAQSIVTRLRNERQLHRLNANCLSLLAVFVAKVNHTLYTASFLRFMLRSGYLPTSRPGLSLSTTSPPPLIANMAPQRPSVKAAGNFRISLFLKEFKILSL
ncbi:Pentatricopeptide repeat-containing protein, chloroplastic [Glycine soja]